MINVAELRWGNQVLFKNGPRIAPVACGAEHFALLAAGGARDFFPVVLKAEVLERHGFIENKDYALYPQAREFHRVLPVKGKEQHALVAYVKSNGDCLAWATVNDLVASNPVYHLHALQNLCFALTGAEL